MPAARVRLPGPLESLLRSEMEHAIRQANLGVYDTGIAQRYLIDRIPQIEIAAEYGTDRKTISNHIKWIVGKVRLTAEKLQPRQDPHTFPIN